ncbi:LacI family DNA-binding transcriptional regulator [Micromonospora chersina]|uniref:Transcriptional regulator, LacI family n=1 Tax=Micromonospora chersina TaxID=47854 RepID=A0A1C6U8W7_9ACTN|nr:LacI family DNA-binding transcriptional regulator [Micromonospora chersina]SCL50545.1 transcriptional regulator, LacI family [Micromonospora chersina]
MTVQQPPVMADVARLAGVSHQTVSRVLHDHPNVRAETRGRVLAAIAELGYRPNSAARTLVTRKSQTLGVINFDTTLYGPASMLYGIEQAARAADYFVSIASLQSIDRYTLVEAVGRLRDQAVEGIVVIAPQVAVAGALEQAAAGTPLVGAASGITEGVPTVGIDQRAGAVLATRHLLELGHRTVHHVAGPTDWFDGIGRMQGWRQELERAGAPVPEPVPGDWSCRSGYLAGRRLAADPTVTAVFCANDHMALGLLRAMHEAGRQVPGDVSIIGFDDIPEASYFMPPLTTVRQDFGELGRRSLQLLVDRLSAGGSGVSGHVVVAPNLVVRGSAYEPRS